MHFPRPTVLVSSREREKTKTREIFSGGRMASLKIPATIPLPEEDSEQLYKAFKGFHLLPSLFD